MTRIRRALLSVSDKSGLGEFAAQLARRGIELVSTGGTASALRSAGLEVVDVADLTGFGATLDGRVKTLHPALFGGILADRGKKSHMRDVEMLGGRTIDLVAVNFYPFERMLVAGAKHDELVENIDIGGPAMVRAAAKNHCHVAVVTDPSDYGRVIREFGDAGTALSGEFTALLAAKAFSRTAEYDRAVAAGLATGVQNSQSTADFMPAEAELRLRRIAALRYGENPHQRAAVYALAGQQGFRQLAGPDVSYNNLQDAVAASRAVVEHDQPTCVVVKHATLCGAATAATAADAAVAAYACDPVSVYGGVVAFNCDIGVAEAELLAGQFVEVLVVPGWSDEVRDRLARRKKLRVLAGPLGANSSCGDDVSSGGTGQFDLRMFGGLVLMQERDSANIDLARAPCPTKAKPAPGALADLCFAWRTVKHCRSNAVLLVSGQRTIGVGAGQTSRVEAARLAIGQARRHGHDPAGSAAASDGFFPFADGLAQLVEAGVASVVQPGGSKRDGEVTAAADRAGVAMIMAGVRHFSH